MIKSMDKKEYIIRQLGRTKNKKYESYVVSRIVHLLNDMDIKFVTQQHITRPNGGRALTDLFFPQLHMHIEVDEEHHKANIDKDRVREADIINATNHEIIRVDVSESIEEINDEIDLIVTKIKNKVEELKSKKVFIPWDTEAEFSSQTYIDRGYIDLADDVKFRTIKDACNCFGHDYTGCQRSNAPHPDKDIMLWFPKLYPNEEWNNQITDDEETIIERNEDDEKARNHVRSHINQIKGEQHKRIIFARVKGNLGDILYRFRGLYKLNLQESSEEKGLVWNRIATRVKTYPNDNTN